MLDNWGTSAIVYRARDNYDLNLARGDSATVHAEDLALVAVAAVFWLRMGLRIRRRLGNVLLRRRD